LSQLRTVFLFTANSIAASSTSKLALSIGANRIFCSAPLSHLPITAFATTDRRFTQTNPLVSFATAGRIAALS
jgi:hypothetical protein